MKIKKLGALLVSAALCAGMAAPAFAFEGEAAPVEQPVLPEVVEEDVVTVTDETSGALTPEGNLTLVDDYHTDYSDGSGQQFITLVSKSGATFYLVIDRNAKGQQTVYFMNLVDEADLLALMEEDAADAYTAEKEAAAQAEQERKQAEEDAKKAAEEAKKNASVSAEKKSSSGQSASSQTTQNASIAASADEETLLAALVQCEAGGTSVQCMTAVGAVVVNRVRSGGFANSIYGVIYQRGQFGPASSGRLEARLASGVSASARQAARAALNGSDPTGGAKYFKLASSGHAGTVVGPIVFY